jgi:alkyldihydroxyacetonephosphate synthase
MWPLVLARLRAGETVASPAAVIRPATVDDVQVLLGWCSGRGVPVVAAGARSGVCGGIAVGSPDAVVLDMRTLQGVEVAPDDLRARALAGTTGPQYAAALDAHGLTPGHVPQSFSISSVGGWLACRSAGQFSTRYGKAEDMLAGLDVVLASGELVAFRPQPSSAAGPDLMRVFCGSEGTLGVIVSATLRVMPRPAQRLPRAFRFATFEDGLSRVRDVIRAGLRPAVVRLYDEADTAWSFPGQSGSVLVLVFEGPLAGQEQAAVAARLPAAADLGPSCAEYWLEHRFDAVGQFERIMRGDGPFGPDAIVDTMEVAGAWSGMHALYAPVRDAIAPHAAGVLAHASHVYADGACLYFTFVVQGADAYERAWEDGMDACLAAGGTITHHHGVGRLKARWLRRELGEGGWTLLTTLKRALDPSGILNPGNLGL